MNQLPAFQTVNDTDRILISVLLSTKKENPYVINIPCEYISEQYKGKRISLHSDVLQTFYRKMDEIKAGKTEKELFFLYIDTCGGLNSTVGAKDFSAQAHIVVTLKCLLHHWFGDAIYEKFGRYSTEYFDELDKHIAEEEAKYEAEQEAKAKEEAKKQKNKEKRERQKEKKREEKSKVRTFIRIQRPQPGSEFTGIKKVWDA